MTHFSQILPLKNIVLDIDVSSKKRAFEQAGLIFENNFGIARSTVSDNLFARERLGSTGLGHGVAVPHGRIKGLKSPPLLPHLSAWRNRFPSNRRTAVR
jgi:nitrogen PTS system EIIA component